jgi:glycerol-3-phosphate cytidylyltransferase
MGSWSRHQCCHQLEYVSGCKEQNADIFVVGEDWGKMPHNLAVESFLKLNGKQIKQVLYNPRTSSTCIKENVVSQFRKTHDISVSAA